MQHFPPKKKKTLIKKPNQTYMIVSSDRRSWFLLEYSTGMLCHDLGTEYWVLGVD